ncbi:MAG: hypothetical protein P8L85_06225, partial [Rubripirellula sp.]|nr:hypothetical protein [Rubripirellula sp.]
ERLQKTNFIHDGLPVGDSRRKLKDCKGQILPFGRPSFNFQQFFGRFLFFLTIRQKIQHGNGATQSEAAGNP